MPIRSTYRLQFRNGMDFAKARRLVPYLETLGISHLYASPVMTAVKGSTHGYDITDANEIDPALGGLAGLRELAGDLHARGLGLILDIVPNHMAAHLDNPWWRSVVTLGAQSPFARHFDIDWSERLTLPFLGRPFEEELAEGAINLALDPGDRRPALRYHDTFYPLHPGTMPPLLTEASREHERVRAIHDAQPWRLTDWKTAGRHLTYRRFFEIAGLVGLRVEDAKVFEDSHGLILDLVREGVVDGLRIDHIDGLADPAAYLKRLRAAIGPQTYIVAEKILERSEALPADWPVQGATGYEFIATLADALVDPQGTEPLRQAFDALKPAEERRPYAAERDAAKRQMLTENFAGETAAVERLAAAIAEAESLDFGRETLREAILAFIVALPVYRTYTTGTAVPESDRALVEKVRVEAGKSANAGMRRAIDFVAGLLTASSATEAQDAFRRRLQQLTGPIMAKAVEDTLFYRENALIALNEVGGDPGTPPGGVAAFHAAMTKRAVSMPEGLSATATHDTKRGEDARARLYALSEAPDLWTAATRRWHALNAHAGMTMPEPAVEWLLYQSLAGAWPIDGATEGLAERMTLYTTKALREAKRRSDWTTPDIEYEDAVAGFVKALLRHDAFLRDFSATMTPFIDAGLMNSLGQTLIKLTAPGIPDIYQGSELGDFSLVDPDNRTPPAMPETAIPAKPLPTRANFPPYKQWLIATVLAAGCIEGPYQPLEIADGDGRALAFLRGTPRSFAIAAVPRLTFGGIRDDVLLLREPARCGAIVLPEGFAGRPLRSILDGSTVTPGARLALATLFEEHPVAFLTAE